MLPARGSDALRVRVVLSGTKACPTYDRGANFL